MKKALLFASIFSIFLAVACTNRTKSEAAVQQTPAFDTSGLAAFQEWQFQNERKDAAEYMQEQAVAQAPVKKVSHKKTPVKKTPAAPVVAAPEQTQQEGTGTVNEQQDSQSGNMGTETTNEAKVEKKKGISNTAKGTAIGAAGGAVLGAVINKKNRVLGGVIGGVIGGGIGYGIGRKMDKNEGR